MEWFAIGNEDTNNSHINTASHDKKMIISKVTLYFVLINLIYVTWGVLQERMMTVKYLTQNGSLENFQQSEFIVLSNRFFSVILSSILLLFWYKKNDPILGVIETKPPFYKYGYSSLSNLLSSWCQYEALKYITFPFQVLAKSCKLVPVMIMGTIVSKKIYLKRQYISALILTIGISLFTYSTSKNTVKIEEGFSRSFLGYILLLAYLIGDSFTSNWQSELYRRYPSISSLEMMFNSSLISFIFMFYSQSYNGFSYSFIFLKNHPTFLIHLCLCSICSSVGQVVIFKTIEDVGPVIFTLIMTTKSLVSILLSCIIYGHTIPPLGIVGILIVFFSLYFEIVKKLKK